MAVNPASPLPWYQGDPGYMRNVYRKNGGEVADCGFIEDAAYIAHACSAYPRLVEMMHVMVGAVIGSREHWHNESIAARMHDLLRELGEL